MSGPRTLAALAAAAALVVAPHVLSSYYVGLAAKILALAVFAMSLDLLLGYTGLPSLGHAAYFGVGAYTVGLLALAGVPSFWVSFPAALVAAALCSALFGLVAVRARASYFLMITLALSQVLWGIAHGWRAFTGGDDGLPGIPRPHVGLPWSMDEIVPFYYFVLAFAALAGLALRIIVRSPFGHALVGIRESESRMAVLGYNVWLYRYVAFILAGSFAGLAGALFVYLNGFVNPSYLTVVVSGSALLMVILGGAGTIVGPALGAGTIVLLENLISAYTERWLTILGAIYVGVTLFAPRGVLGLIREGLTPGEGGS